MRGSNRLKMIAAVLALLVLVIACRAVIRKVGPVDTTKDVYSDDEAPKVQVVVLNGQPKEIPWAEVPENRRYIVEYDSSGGYKVRVPIVKIEILSADKEGRPVPPEQGYFVEYTKYGLNPKHWSHVLAGQAH